MGIKGSTGSSVKIGPYTLRKPWVKYVEFELDIEAQMTRAILNSIRSDIVADIITLDLCDQECDVIDYLKKTSRP